MAALPYIQFYPADYLADTAHLSTEEHGAYFLLILNYWQRGVPLPDDDKRLAIITRLSNERWTNVKQTLKEFFDVKDGFWIHYRIESDLDKVKSKSVKNSEAGKLSARARMAKKSTNVQTNVATNAEQTYERNVNHTDIDIDTDIDNIRLTNVSLVNDDDVNDDILLKKPKKPAPPYQDIVDLFTKILPTLPAVYKLNETRKRHIRELWADELDDLEYWQNFFISVSKSDFLMGRAPPGKDGRTWQATFDWIIKPANFIKIAEKQYHAKKRV